MDDESDGNRKGNIWHPQTRPILYTELGNLRRATANSPRILQNKYCTFLQTSARQPHAVPLIVECSASIVYGIVTKMWISDVFRKKAVNNYNKSTKMRLGFYTVLHDVKVTQVWPVDIVNSENVPRAEHHR